MKRLFCMILTCLLLIGIMPVSADALNLQSEPHTAPVLELDYSDQLRQAVFNDVGENEYDESEPNDDPENANLIESGYTVYGSLSQTDILDVYEFTLVEEAEIALVSLAEKESLLCAVVDVDGDILGVSEVYETAEGYFIEGVGGTLPAGTYYFMIIDENEEAAEYVIYFEIHTHTFVSEVTAPTCTNEGYTTYTCDCGLYYTEDYVSALGHTYTDDSDALCDRCGYEREVSSEDPTEPEDAVFTAREWEVLKLTNRERLKEGLDPLTCFSTLQKAADIRTVEIIEYFSHTRPNGSSCFTVAEELDLDYRAMGENIASGQTTPAWVVNAWMNSDGHRANILNSSFTHLGVGEQSNNWVQLFLGGVGNYTSISVDSVSVLAGTTIDEMNLVAELNHSTYGVCYLPVEASYCQGYNPQARWTQTVTISVLGVSSTFEIEVRDHDHIWSDATCSAPKTCTICGNTEGTALEHTWTDATCTAPKTCSVWGGTEGATIDHTWTDATCTAPKTCSVCGTTEGTAVDHTWTDATCFAAKTCSTCGTTEGDALGHKYKDGICENCGRSEKTMPMYRLYNPYTQEHLLTSNESEMRQLVSVGWSLDGIAWNAPLSGLPVYRLYNPYDDWHTYTMSQEEIDMLVPLGWKVDGVVCYSSVESDSLPIFRLFNPYELKNYHLLTADPAERDLLESVGWIVEGVAWRAVK